MSQVEKDVEAALQNVSFLRFIYHPSFQSLLCVKFVGLTGSALAS